MSRLLGLTPERIRSLEKAKKALEKREREASVNTVVSLLQSLSELHDTSCARRSIFFFLHFPGKRYRKHIFFFRK